MPIGKTYRTAPDKTLSVSFIDIVTGKGYQIFNMGATNRFGSFAYILSPNDFFSDTRAIATILKRTTDASGVLIDLDFDTDIERPLVIEGDAFVTTAWSQKNVSGGAAAVVIRFLKSISKVSGGVETVLVNGITSGVSVINDANEKATLKLNVPRTKFTKGDTLRVTTKLDAVYNNAGTVKEFAIGHDPKDRESLSANTFLSAGLTVSEAQIPILID